MRLSFFWEVRNLCKFFYSTYFHLHKVCYNPYKKSNQPNLIFENSLAIFCQRKLSSSILVLSLAATFSTLLVLWKQHFYFNTSAPSLFSRDREIICSCSTFTGKLMPSLTPPMPKTEPTLGECRGKCSKCGKERSFCLNINNNRLTVSPKDASLEAAVWLMFLPNSAKWRQKKPRISWRMCMAFNHTLKSRLPLLLMTAKLNGQKKCLKNGN